MMISLHETFCTQLHPTLITRRILKSTPRSLTVVMQESNFLIQVDLERGPRILWNYCITIQAGNIAQRLKLEILHNDWSWKYKFCWIFCSDVHDGDYDDDCSITADVNCGSQYLPSHCGYPSPSLAETRYTSLPGSALMLEKWWFEEKVGDMRYEPTG